MFYVVDGGRRDDPKSLLPNPKILRHPFVLVEELQFISTRRLKTTIVYLE